MSNESLSALLDGECSDAEIDRLLRQMDASPELAQQWGRWHLQRDLADGASIAPDICICAGVMAGLEEPVSRGRVVDLSAWRRRVVELPWKPAVGFAAAASMGAAAVLFMGPQQQGIGSVQPAAGGPEGEAYGANVRVSNPVVVRPMGGRLQAVSLTGDNYATTFADEEYAALLRDYIASRNSALAEQTADAGYPAAYSTRYVRFDAANEKR
jgi:negative regulator of sigma E activity